MGNIIALFNFIMGDHREDGVRSFQKFQPGLKENKGDSEWLNTVLGPERLWNQAKPCDTLSN